MIKIDRMLDTHFENYQKQINEWKKEMNSLQEKMKCELDENRKEYIFQSIKLLHFNIVLLEEEQKNQKNLKNIFFT